MWSSSLHLLRLMIASCASGELVATVSLQLTNKPNHGTWVLQCIDISSSCTSSSSLVYVMPKLLVSFSTESHPMLSVKLTAERLCLPQVRLEERDCSNAALVVALDARRLRVSAGSCDRVLFRLHPRPSILLPGVLPPSPPSPLSPHYLHSH